MTITVDSTGALEQCRAIAAGDIENLLVLGRAYIESGRQLDAIIAFKKVLKIDASRPEAHMRLGCLYLDVSDVAKAILHLEKFHEVFRILPITACRLSAAYAYMGRFDKARQLCRLVIQDPSAPLHAVSEATALLNYDPHLSPAKLNSLHKAAALKFEGQRPMVAHTQRAGTRIRVGYVSPDFRNHACGYFLLPIIKAHDRARFEVFCYANNSTSDNRTALFQEATDVWRDIHQLNDQGAAKLVTCDGIDVLVDCAGYTFVNRLSMFALRPAPNLVSFLGYPRTTGLQAIDFHLTDPTADPIDEPDQNFTGKLVRLPNGYLTYTPSCESQLVEQRTYRNDGCVVFGCFNNWLKVGPFVRSVWAEILKRVPNSRLVLKDRVLKYDEVAKQVLSEFSAHKIDPSRIEFKNYSPTSCEHMLEYLSIDIALDPFPYNGTTTTCDALWMGVPVVALRGDRHAGRITASILERVGLRDLVANDPNEYINIAVALAAEKVRLAELHRELRERVIDSPLGQPQLVVRDIEVFYDAISRGGSVPFV